MPYILSWFLFYVGIVLRAISIWNIFSAVLFCKVQLAIDDGRVSQNLVFLSSSVWESGIVVWRTMNLMVIFERGGEIFAFMDIFAKYQREMCAEMCIKVSNYSLFVFKMRESVS